MTVYRKRACTAPAFVEYSHEDVSYGEREMNFAAVSELGWEAQRLLVARDHKRKIRSLFISCAIFSTFVVLWTLASIAWKLLT